MPFIDIANVACGFHASDFNHSLSGAVLGVLILSRLIQALRWLEAGVNAMILNGSAVDGSYWLSAVPDLSNFHVPVQGSIYADDPNPDVTTFNARYKEAMSGDPSTQYTYPGYVMIDAWAKAVERAGTTEAGAVVAELEEMNEQPPLFGPRTLTPELHHQNRARYLIVETTAGKPGVVDEWTIAEPIPVAELMK